MELPSAEKRTSRTGSLADARDAAEVPELDPNSDQVVPWSREASSPSEVPASQRLLLKARSYTWLRSGWEAVVVCAVVVDFVAEGVAFAEADFAPAFVFVLRAAGAATLVTTVPVCTQLPRAAS
jgi:hypothetical protein